MKGKEQKRRKRQRNYIDGAWKQEAKKRGKQWREKEEHREQRKEKSREEKHGGLKRKEKCEKR